MPEQYATYTWATFQAAVLDLLDVDSDREGINTPRSAHLRQAVIQLQTLIPRYRCNHESIYLPQDLAPEGCASRGVKPPESVIKDAWLFQVATEEKTVAGEQVRVPVKGAKGNRFAVERYPYPSRFQLVNGLESVNAGRGLMAADPNGYTFYIYPEVRDEWMLSLFWDGLKLDFQDDEQVPFDELMAGAVAFYVKAQIARCVDKDMQAYDTYMRDWSLSKPRLWSAAREKG